MDKYPKKVQTNPRYKTFTQPIFTAGDVEQFSSKRVRTSLGSRKIDLKDNLFREYTLVLRWDKYEKVDLRAVTNTFRYLFYKFKKGIFVRISDNKLTTFLPFSNAHFKNEWSDRIAVDPRFSSIQNFLDHVSKLSGYRTSKAKPTNEWYANNALLRFEYEQNEGDNNVVIIHDMFAQLCEKREVPDVEFFVNRRDFPLLRTNETEPYNHIYDSNHHPLVSHNYPTYSPILSGSTSWMYADVGLPTYEDWARIAYQASGKKFPNAFREYPKIKQVPWKDKKAVAVFRGGTTGAGVIEQTNQRLKALKIAEGNPDLDVGITGWNLRVRKYEGEKYLQTIERKSYPKANRLSLQDQAGYKYIINLEGHVAAYRLSYEMSAGSAIIMPTNNKWNIWYFRFLGPYKHYVPISADLHDLEAKVEWCRQNDDKCKKIAENAKQFYKKYLGEDGVLDYLQKELVELAKMLGAYEYLPDLLDIQIEDEKSQLPTHEPSSTPIPFPLRPGPRCVGMLDGCSKVFNASPKVNFVKSLFKNKGGTIDLYETNKIFMVGKKASLPEKHKEHIHEAYLGLNAINSLLAKVPNFAHVYGLKDDTVFIEYIPGTTMLEWLQSPTFSFTQLLSILVQINLALHVAQQEKGFIHYDMYPWNIMLQKIPQPTSFDYHIQENVSLRYESTFIPTIIDYGKSRAVVHEEEYGSIDHGFVNLYQTNAILDTLTLILSCLDTLRGKLSQPQAEILLKFLDIVGIPRDVEGLKRFGALFDYPNDDNLTPMKFVDYILSLNQIPMPSLVKNENFDFKMERGNPIQTFSLMKYNDDSRALMDIIVHIDRSTLPRSSDGFFQQMILGLLTRRLKWLDADVEKTSTTVKAKWKRTIKLLYLPQPKIEIPGPYVEYPLPEQQYMDAELTPTFVKQVKKELGGQFERDNWIEDWPKILSITLDSSLMGLIPENNVDVRDFIQMDNFAYQNALASNNTLIKLNHIFDLK